MCIGDGDRRRDSDVCSFTFAGCAGPDCRCSACRTGADPCRFLRIRDHHRRRSWRSSRITSPGPPRSRLAWRRPALGSRPWPSAPPARSAAVGARPPALLRAVLPCLRPALPDRLEPVASQLRAGLPLRSAAGARQAPGAGGSPCGFRPALLSQAASTLCGVRLDAPALLRLDPAGRR